MLSIYSLWRRDVIRFLRQPSRVVGALASPVLFWLVIGSGLGSSFQSTQANQGGPDAGGFLQYYFPGSLALIVLFTAIFSTISIIEDRQEGFLQGVLASPAPRVAIVLGKALGSTTLALLNGVLFLALLPFAGLAPGFGALLLAVAFVALLGLALAGLGLVIAWPLRSTQGFHAIMNIVLVPLWLLSGALFPATGAAGWVKVLMRLNPLTPAVAALRALLVGGSVADVPAAAATLAASAIVTLSIATLLVSRPSR